MRVSFALLGHPVGHSRSPAMHAAALAAANIAGDYMAFDVPQERLKPAIDGLFALGFSGFNVTVPHKLAVMEALESVDARARRIGAVNTAVRTPTGFRGTNTDGLGFVRSLEAEGLKVDAQNALVLGAGGAARAVVAGLLEAGVGYVGVAARRATQAEALVADLADPRLEALPLNGNLAPHFSRCGLLVQATSVTLESASEPAETRDRREAFVAALPLSALPDAAVVSDLVYAPRETALLRAAKHVGRRTVDGTGMLLHQGALAFEAWLGVVPDVGVMRAALDASLERTETSMAKPETRR